MTAQDVFLYPAQLVFDFFLSLIGLTNYGLGSGWNQIITLFLAVIIWGKFFKIMSAIIKRITGFEHIQ